MTTPETAEELAAYLARLRSERGQRKRDIKKAIGKARSPSPDERQEVLGKTAGRCHVCGGKVDRDWQADHVFARAAGGLHEVDNYLPAHPICNRYRWDYPDSELQYILRLGVWARTQVERQTATGRDIADRFLAYERGRARRRDR